MCLLSERFRTYGNLQILLLNGSVIAFLALGQAFVLLTGGIDGLVKPDVSLQKTTEMLQADPDINLIWADTGPAAQGALRAVKSLNAQAKVYGFAIADYPVESLYPAAAAQEPYQYAKNTLQQIRDYLDGKNVPKKVLRPLKIITSGKPAPGEVG